MNDDRPCALVLFSHGSLLCGAGKTLELHAQRLREGNRFARVEIGYLNYSEPSFLEAVDKCVDAGILRIIVVPYFLVAGKFITEDLPACIAAARERHPQAEIRQAEVLGHAPEVPLALLTLARETLSGKTPQVTQLLPLPGEFPCTGNPNCPLFNTPGCPASEWGTEPANA